MATGWDPNVWRRRLRCARGNGALRRKRLIGVSWSFYIMYSNSGFKFFSVSFSFSTRISLSLFRRFQRHSVRANVCRNCWSNANEWSLETAMTQRPFSSNPRKKILLRWHLRRRPFFWFLFLAFRSQNKRDKINLNRFSSLFLILCRFGPVCPQRLPNTANETAALERMPKGRLEYLRRLLPHLQNQSEDCLYLNIYVPIQGEYPFCDVFFYISPFGCLRGNRMSDRMWSNKME